MSSDRSLPFRPGLPLKQLNALFGRCHSRIRDIEKNEEHAFSDFSKLLFLKLLEEKSDAGQFKLPYSYQFHELAQKPETEADQVKDAISTMLELVKQAGYGDVLAGPIHLKNPKTFQFIVKHHYGCRISRRAMDDLGFHLPCPLRLTSRFF